MIEEEAARDAASICALHDKKHTIYPFIAAEQQAEVM
jgi:hypothetical protein